MIECASLHCQTMINGSAIGKNPNGSTRRNKICGRCVRHERMTRMCSNDGCITIRSKYSKNTKRCARCVRLDRTIKRIKAKPPKGARVRGVFVRKRENGKMKYIRVGSVDKFGMIHIFEEVI